MDSKEEAVRKNRSRVGGGAAHSERIERVSRGGKERTICHPAKTWRQRQVVV